MAAYSQLGSKRQKTLKEPTKFNETNDFFSNISKIEYKGDIAQIEDVLCYRYYNANEKIYGKSFEEWIRPALSISMFKSSGLEWFVKSGFQKVWDDRNMNTIENYKQLFKASFEFCSKLGIKYYTVLDKEFAPETENNEESLMFLDEMVEYVQEMQQRYGVRPLWIAPDLHSNRKYASGAGSTHDSTIFIHSAQQTKKCLEIAQKLNAENFVMFNAREGYNFILNTDVQREMKNYARLLKMISDYKERLGLRIQLLLCPQKITPLEYNHYFDIENTYMYSHTPNNLYFWDATSCLCLLKHFNLDKFFKICIEPGHQFYITNVYNAVGSIELRENLIDNNYQATLLMKKIMEQGGISPGGINLKLTPKKDSIEMKDIFITFINCIDTLAKGVRTSGKMLADPLFTKIIQQKYLTFYNGIGNRITNGEASLEECEEQLRKSQMQNLEQTSGKFEQWKSIFKNYVDSQN